MKLMDLPKAKFMPVAPAGDIEKLMDALFVNTKEYIVEKLGHEVNPFF